MVENDTGLQLLVSNNPDSPPSTDVGTAWRLVPPGANVTWPLGSAGVAYRLLGTPAANTAVQTILSDQAAPAGGTTGTVNIASGNVNVTGPVNIQTATGVSIGTKAVILPGSATFGVPSSGSLTLQTDVQSIQIQFGGFPGTVSGPVRVTLIGNNSGTTYYNGLLAQSDLITIRGILLFDTQLNVTVAGPAGGQVAITQSTGSPALAANDIMPASEFQAATGLTKNLWVHEASAKKSAIAFPNTVAATQLIAAPGVGSAIQLHSGLFQIDAAAAGQALTLNAGGAALLLVIGAVGQAVPIDFKGLPLPQNTNLNVTLNNAVQWRAFVTYTIVAV